MRGEIYQGDIKNGQQMNRVKTKTNKKRRLDKQKTQRNEKFKTKQQNYNYTNITKLELYNIVKCYNMI